MGINAPIHGNEKEYSFTPTMPKGYAHKATLQILALRPLFASLLEKQPVQLSSAQLHSSNRDIPTKLS